MRGLIPKKISRTVAAIAVFALANCNMEVGNPDTGETPASLMHTVNLRLVPYGKCAAELSSCNAIPVELGISQSALRYELTSAQFSLVGITPTPFAEQYTNREIELLHEPALVLPQPVSAQQVSDLGFRFAVQAKNTTSWQLDGRLRGNLVGVDVDFALPLSGVGEIYASTALPTDGFDAIYFDAAVWFDFRAEPQFAKLLDQGACREQGNRLCAQLYSVIAQQVEKRISRSLKATAPKKTGK